MPSLGRPEPDRDATGCGDAGGPAHAARAGRERPRERGLDVGHLAIGDRARCLLRIVAANAAPSAALEPPDVIRARGGRDSRRELPAEDALAPGAGGNWIGARELRVRDEA